MAVIEPMHRNKPNVTHLLVYVPALTSGSSRLSDQSTTPRVPDLRNAAAPFLNPRCKLVHGL